MFLFYLVKSAYFKKVLEKENKNRKHNDDESEGKEEKD